MSFEIAIAFTLQEEGGDQITNDPNDPGGLTKYGLSARYNPGLDIANLTEEQAASIYRLKYWSALRCDELPAGLAIAAFDCAVNPGPGAAAHVLQAAVGVTSDGIIGPQTVQAAQHIDQTVAINAVCDGRKTYYESRPNFATFGKGWLARTERCRALALANLQ